MAGHIGTLAHLMPALPTSEIQVSNPERFIFQESAEKRWGFATSRGARLRSWQVESNGISSEQSSALAELAEGAWGVGPFVFVPCPAHDSNVLTPAQSLLEGVANGGIVVLPEGATSPVSVVGGSNVTLADKIPVLPGKPVTVSIYIAGGSCTVTYKNLAGVAVGSRSLTPTSGVMQRVTITSLEVPAAARYATITATGYTALTRPQVSWTSEVVPWAVGGAASNVVIQDSTQTPIGGGWATGKTYIVEVG